MVHVGCLVRMERTQDCSFGAVRRLGVVDAVDQ